MSESTLVSPGYIDCTWGITGGAGGTFGVESASELTIVYSPICTNGFGTCGLAGIEIG
jgi:hypothetical protein